MIHDLRRQGLGISAIARETGLNPKTVLRHLDRDIEAPPYGRRHHARGCLTPSRGACPRGSRPVPDSRADAGRLRQVQDLLHRCARGGAQGQAVRPRAGPQSLPPGPVLCSSLDQRTVLFCDVLAFEAIGGVPQEILYDRMKTAVLGKDADGGWRELVPR